MRRVTELPWMGPVHKVLVSPADRLVHLQEMYPLTAVLVGLRDAKQTLLSDELRRRHDALPPPLLPSDGGVHLFLHRERLERQVPGLL